ncbi:MAG: hypothetical protein C4547_04650 [Phycisphaerales bacterium]|nr:MAG: hypothetical protein C4547_04650 [Phycisphaerales bacterium]
MRSGLDIRFVAAVLAVAVVSVWLLRTALPADFAVSIVNHAVLTFLFDGVPALAIVAAMIGAGIGVLQRGSQAVLPTRWMVLLGAVAGIGGTSTLVLVLGSLGLLHRPLWIGILTLEAVAAAAALRSLRRSGEKGGALPPNAGDEWREPAQTHARSSSDGAQAQGGTSSVGAQAQTRGSPGVTKAQDARSLRHWRWLWLLVVPFAIAALLVAAQAPGYLWQEEGYGYDILEYHLQVPKEYMQAGRITYLPHNVYANFPSLVEMLYLLCMIVWDDPVAGGSAANYMHLALAALAVAAAWLGGREWSPRAGIVAGVAAGTCGWLVYLSGLAYVENGMLFFGTAGLAAIFWFARLCQHGKAAGGGAAEPAPAPWLVIAGLAAGLACGCKYTAVPMVLVPLALAALAAQPGGTGWGGRICGAAVVFVAGVLAFSPWLIKNAWMTGNPVFPLANSVFDAHPPGWSEASQQRWDEGHAASSGDQSIGAGAGATWRHIIWDGPDHRFGALLILLPIVGICAAWTASSEPRASAGADVRQENDSQHHRPLPVRSTLTLLLLVLGVQWIVWLFATHLYARFAVVMIPALALLCGCAATARVRPVSALVVTWLVIGGCTNFAYVRRMIGREVAVPGVAAWFQNGQMPGFEYLGRVNGLGHNVGSDTAKQTGPADTQRHRLLMLGDAKAFYVRPPAEYCVVFNENPFAAAVRAARDEREIVAWLRDRGITHVLVNWLEVQRLRRTYGFPEEITPALFGRLESGGVGLLESYELPGSSAAGGDRARYVDLYEVRARR